MKRSIKWFLALLLVIASLICMLLPVYAEEVNTEDQSTEPTITNEDPAEEGQEPVPQSATMVTHKSHALVKTNTFEWDDYFGEETDYIWYVAPNGKTDRRNGLWLHMIQPLGSDDWHMSYCLEPGIDLVDSLYGEDTSYNQEELLFTELLEYANKPKYLTDDQLRVIALTVLYGEQEIPAVGDFEELGDWAATQILIWEFAQGYREITPPYTLLDDLYYRRFSDYRTGSDYSGEYTGCNSVFGRDYATGVYGKTFGVQEKIDALVEKLINHNTMLRFRDESGNVIELSRIHDDTVPVIALTVNADGTYSATLTDLSGTLDQYVFADTDTVKFSVNGDALTITATGAVESVVFQPYRMLPTLSDEVFYLWYYEDAQNLMSCVTQPTDDPVPAYFKIQTPDGDLQILKETEDGTNLEGWLFEIYSDAACTNRIVGPCTTDSNGNILVAGLLPGTVWVKEIGHSDETINAQYKCHSPNPQQVTIQAGAVVAVSFYNKLNSGIAQIVKTATNGGTVEGWEFTIMDADGNVVGTYTTDSTGTIAVELEPGVYTVQEADPGDPYWQCDTEPQMVTVEAGETATVTFRNQWFGKAKIIKTLANPEAGTVEGWSFAIMDDCGNVLGTYQTDSEGVILVDLEPGTYIVKEALEDNSPWQCTSENPQTITVTAGQTAEVTFTNALRPGEITVQKVNHEGTPLAGAEFLLEWSEDGVNWHPVTYSDSAVVSKGTCSSVDLQDGKLVSGADGLVVFTGLYPTLQYRLTETKAPDGYQLLASFAYEGVLPVDGNLTVSLTVVNIPVFELPETGSHDAVLLPISVILCLCLCAGLVIYLRKQ